MQSDATADDPRPETEHGLTNNQRLIHAGQRLAPDAAAYNMVLCFHLAGDLDPGRFARAFDTLVQTNDALHSVVLERDGIPSWHARPHSPAALERHHFDDDDLTSWLDRQRQRRFELDRCLYHSALIRRPDGDRGQRWLWYLNQHHLITDGVSTQLIFRRMAQVYRDTPHRGDAPEPRFPAYRAYQGHEQAVRGSPEYRSAREFWGRRLQRPLQRSQFYGASPGRPSARSERLVRDLGAARSARLLALAQDPAFRGLTPDIGRFLLFATILLTYLHRIGGETRLRIGVPFHNRPTPEFKETLGLFMEICPLEVEIAADESFASLAAKLRADLMQVVRHARPGVSSAQANRGYDVLLNYVNISFGDFDGLPAEVEWLHAGHGDRDHGLRLQVHDFGARDRFELLFDFNCGLFDPAQRELAIGHFLKVCDSCLDDPQRRLGAFDLLTTAEHQALRAALEPLPTPTPTPAATVLDLIAAQVRARPDATAITEHGAPLSYRQLQMRTEAVAAGLAAHGIGAGERVGVLLPRSLDAVVAILGVLRAGAAFVPLDPSHPAERSEALLRDLGANPDQGLDHDLEQQRGAWFIGSATHGLAVGRCLPLHQLETSADTAADVGTRPALPQADDLAYLIYTSGSSGRPKGVLIDHRALLNYSAWAGQHYLSAQPASFPLYSSLCFDLTITSIFVPLSVGGRIVVYPPPAPDGASAGGDLVVRDVVRDNQVDVLKLTPSHLRLLLDLELSTSRIRLLILGGEGLPAELARRAHQAFGGSVQIDNEYGPTEATVGCMHHRYDPQRDRRGSVPIGRPIAGARVQLLDRYRQPVPPQVPGELYLAGRGLARGYLKRPQETAERFVAEPGAKPGAKPATKPDRGGERAYRSGDRAWWRGDGALEYLGRCDDQIKYKGVRLEPAEIEAALCEHPRVGAAAVRLLGAGPQQPLRHCERCGLPSNYPDATIDAAGLCSLCRDYDRYRPAVAAWFRDLPALDTTLRDLARRKQGAYDALVLLSGGKDSTYMLYRVVAMGFNVTAMSLDNGFISDQAMANIRRVVAHLGIAHRFVSTPEMNAIFADSLRRHSNVCNGCFKTIYTLSLKLALEQGIPAIVTGLSRGQLFETRLGDLFGSGETDPATIDAMVLDARKAYHREQDYLAEALDTRAFADDRVFEQVRFVDFYRYCDVDLDEVYGFLDRDTPWRRPSDTGRSTNCRVNDVGIWVHDHERGYHNYALPYSWDVRLGHKERSAALQELDDELDPQHIDDMLQTVGYEPGPAHQAQRLVAWYSGADDGADDGDNPAGGRPEPSLLLRWLEQRLPAFMRPHSLLPVASIPLTGNGKIDRDALPDPRQPGLSATATPGAPQPPRTPLEATLCRLWEALFRLPMVGIHDDFFALGGDSIINIQLCAQARREGIELRPEQVFTHSSIAALAAVATPHTPKVDAPAAAADGTADASAFADTGLAPDELQELLDDLDADAKPPP